MDLKMIFQIPNLFLLSLLLLFSISINSAETIISLGSTLYASNKTQIWSSPNNTYSLRFIPFDPPTSPPSFIAAISYFGGSVTIWSPSANGSPLTVDSGGTLRFLSSGNLQLVNGSDTILWDSGTSGQGVSSALIDDNGNLILRNSSAVVWSTFENPSDSIVPTQNFTVGKVLQSGLYSFIILPNGNLTLLWNNTIVYWNQGLNQLNITSPALQLKSIGILSISDPSLKSDYIVAYSNDYAEGIDILRFLKLDSDGNLRIYSSARSSGTKIERWAAVKDQCQVYGYCGNMGICSYNESNVPVCRCPSLNFDLVDPKDSKKGCKRKKEIQDCPGSATMLELNHTQFLTYPPEYNSQVFSVGISACRGNCLVSGSCVASTALSDGSGFCFFKATSDFLSGYVDPSMSSRSFIKVCVSVIPNPTPLP